jgi:hypothetical protein
MAHLDPFQLANDQTRNFLRGQADERERNRILVSALVASKAVLQLEDMLVSEHPDKITRAIVAHRLAAFAFDAHEVPFVMGLG